MISRIQKGKLRERVTVWKIFGSTISKSRIFWIDMINGEKGLRKYYYFCGKFEIIFRCFINKNNVQRKSRLKFRTDL